MTARYGGTIDATGASAPDFQTVLANLLTDVTAVTGADTVLTPDSQMGQVIGIFAQAVADCNAAFLAAYNSFSPATAQGAGLASNIKLNGLQKRGSSLSTVDALLVGIAGTPITNGQFTDDATNSTWLLPAFVQIPIGGSITVTATASAAGAISINAGTATIATPVYGWQSVAIASSSVPGTAQETDPQLRVRQSVSTEQPSLTIFEGIVAAIKNVPGVTRARGYENTTNATDANGIPAGNVAFVVEGGADSDIQSAIATKSSPGMQMTGMTSATVVDSTGSTKVVKFSRPTAAVITVQISLTAETGWSVNIEPLISQALANYLNALDIGQSISYRRLDVPANLSNSQFSTAYTITALTFKKNGGGALSADAALAYNEVASCDPSAGTTYVVS